MKTKFTVLLLSTIYSISIFAQTENKSFDSKFRFGLRVNPQPCWYNSGNKNLIKNGLSFGYGFGLNLEYRFSDVVGLLTGIGGDFEGGKLKFKSDVTNNFQIAYFKNSADEFILPSNNTSVSDLKKSGNTAYLVRDRTIKTTFVTIPAILKLSTKDINGIKYFGLFGIEIGIRTKTRAEDTFDKVIKYSSDSTFEILPEKKISNINISKDASLIPMRLGLNVGFGFEYKLSGSTAFFTSINYFNSFTNFARSNSKTMFTNWQVIDAAKGGTKVSYSMLAQSVMQQAIRINIGFMF